MSKAKLYFTDQDPQEIDDLTGFPDSVIINTYTS